MTISPSNQLYFGDNLPILREQIADESVDLIYLDPPFNSNVNYNVMFRERSGQQSEAQITAFRDTWRWGLQSESAYRDVVTNGPTALADLMQSSRGFLGQSQMIEEAAAAGFYEPEHFPGHRFPRVQILTIDELLNGVQPEIPRFAPLITYGRGPSRRGLRRRLREVAQSSLI